MIDLTEFVGLLCSAIENLTQGGEEARGDTANDIGI